MIIIIILHQEYKKGKVCNTPVAWQCGGQSQWRSHRPTSGVRGVRTPCQEKYIIFWYAIFQWYVITFLIARTTW